MCGFVAVSQPEAPLGTPEPSQYWVMVPDHCSPPVPMPRKRFCRYVAALFGSPLPAHWPPQNTRYTRGTPLVTPMPPMPPPYSTVSAAAPVLRALVEALQVRHCS